MTGDCPVEKDGAIAVEMGRIHAFGSREQLLERYPDAEFKEHTGCVLMPGLINAHCHLDLVSYFNPDIVPGSEVFFEPEEQLEFASMLVDTIDYKHDAKTEEVIMGIQRGVARLIETGVTCVGDMTHFEGTFKILREAGLRAVVFPEILAGRGELAQQKFEIALALLDKYTDATHDRIRVGLGPYAPYLLSRNLLKIISQHARDAMIPLMIHAAESFAEMEFFFDSQGTIATEVFPSLGWNELPPAQRKTPVTYLSEIGFFEAPTVIVGGLQLADKDFSLLARHLVRVVWCPTVTQSLKHGQFPYGKLSEYGIPTGLGTEIWMERMGFNLWEEMRSAVRIGAQPLPAPREVLRMATIGGARALGLDHITGTLEENKKADYIIVHAPTWDPLEGNDALFERLVRTTEPQHVRKVVVGGAILKSV